MSLRKRYSLALIAGIHYTKTACPYCGQELDVFPGLLVLTRVLLLVEWRESKNKCVKMEAVQSVFA